MNSSKLALALVAMVVMGALSFWGLGALWSHRIGHSVTPAAPRDALSIETPLESLRVGARQSFEAAARHSRRTVARTPLPLSMPHIAPLA